MQKLLGVFKQSESSQLFLSHLRDRLSSAQLPCLAHVLSFSVALTCLSEAGLSEAVPCSSSCKIGQEDLLCWLVAAFGFLDFVPPPLNRESNFLASLRPRFAAPCRGGLAVWVAASSAARSCGSACGYLALCSATPQLPGWLGDLQGLQQTSKFSFPCT